MAVCGKEHDTTRPTYRDEVHLRARDAIEEQARRTQAWILLENALIEALAQRDDLLTAAEALLKVAEFRPWTGLADLDKRVVAAFRAAIYRCERAKEAK